MFHGQGYSAKCFLEVAVASVERSERATRSAPGRCVYFLRIKARGRLPDRYRSAARFAAREYAHPSNMFCVPLEQLIVAESTNLGFLCNPPQIWRRTNEAG
jgi:hypothetical protein